MKREAGLTTGVLVAALASFGVFSIQNKATEGAGSSQSSFLVAPAHKAPTAEGECDELQATFDAFFSLETPDAHALPASCSPERESVRSAGADHSKAETVSDTLKREQNFGVQVVVATLADPLHTHLPLTFDRQAEAIQEAAADECFTYDKSWMPWETTEDPSVFLADRDVIAERNKQREHQPGVLLFRRSVSRGCIRPADRLCSASDKVCENETDPYKNGLIVFVAGEEPTEGIHREQFKNAFRWMRYLQRNGVASRGAVSILGPSFSGSLPSLAQLLSGEEIAHSLAGRIPIYSGQVTSNEGVAWFERQFSDPTALTVDFRSFQIDDDTALKRYEAFVDDIAPGRGSSRLAIISEDETAYGYHVPAQTEGALRASPRLPADCREPCSAVKGTAWFYYPRDISALRAAYQEQSVFSKDASSATDTTRRTLKSDLADPEGKAHDTVRNYGGSQTALSQEAVLLQIVSMLRAHNSQFLLLRSSNPLDALFLAKFFRTTYPEGRVVVQGNDLLLRRDIGASGLNGTMTLETYPVLPAADDWMGWVRHSHRAFTQDGAQGTYIALRYLLPKKASGSNTLPDIPCKLVSEGNSPFAPWVQDSRDECNVPGYSAPFWLTASQGNASQRRPSTWITVLGNDGFNPVAAIGNEHWTKPPLYAAIYRSFSAFFSRLLVFRNQTLAASAGRWAATPFSMNMCMLAVLGLAVFHLICCTLPSVTVKPEHRSYYARFVVGKADKYDAKHHRLHVSLLVTESVLLVLMALVTSWGYGWFYGEGEPVPTPFLYTIFPLVVWLVAFASLFVSGWLEKRLRQDEHAEISVPAFREMRDVFGEMRVAFAMFVGATLFFYVLFSAGIDEHLAPSVRVLTYLRAMHLTTGVSPTVPLLLLCTGMYGWCWYALRGQSFFGEDRPQLPPEHELLLPAKEHLQQGQTQKQYLSPIGRKRVAWKLEKLCQPFSKKIFLAMGINFCVLVLSAFFLSDGVPLRSLGTQRYSYLICIWIGISISVLIANVWQLTRIWLMLHNLLSFLDRLPLRRTIMTMSDFSWSSIWKMSGNVLDFRYRLFYRQSGVFNHLRASLLGSDLDTAPGSQAAQLIAAIDSSQSYRSDFAEWYSRNWWNWKARDLSTLRSVQEETARFAGRLIVDVLLPAWTAQDHPNEPVKPASEEDSSPSVKAQMPKSVPLYVRNAEELVCLVYLAFIQNVLGRMRALVTGMVWLFLSIAFVVPSYPFDPRPVLTGAVITLFLVVGAAVFLVYAQMFRDATLSHLTNTKPGELGGEFWFKLISFGVGPALGLLASVFPDISSSFLGSFLPSLASLK